MKDDVITLADGRALAFAEGGDLAGTPVLFFHGGPSSRVCCPDEELCRARNVRWIAPDRPGYGRSDPKPGLRLLDWPADVGALADTLGIERFSIIGWSGGGAPALACAVAIPERLSTVVMVTSAGPTDRVPGLMENDANRRMVYEGMTSDPTGTEAAVAAFLSPATADVEQYIAGMAESGAGDPAWDNEAWSANLRDSIREGLRQGAAGLVGDACSAYGPWGFELSDVRTHVHVCSGSLDTITPPYNADYVVSALPSATRHHWERHGHGAMYSRFADILDLVA